MTRTLKSKMWRRVNRTYPEISEGLDVQTKATILGQGLSSLSHISFENCTMEDKENLAYCKKILEDLEVVYNKLSFNSWVNDIRQGNR